MTSKLQLEIELYAIEANRKTVEAIRAYLKKKKATKPIREKTLPSPVDIGRTAA
jgi:hypothetical protein